MSTRYVWKKYAYTSSENRVERLKTIPISNISNIYISNTEPTVDSATKLYSIPEGAKRLTDYGIVPGFENADTSTASYIVYNTPQSTWYIFDSSDLSHYYYSTFVTSAMFMRILFGYVPDNSYNQNNSYYSSLPCLVPIEELSGDPISYTISTNTSFDEYKLKTSQGSLIETLSSPSKNAYPEGVSGEYYYVYQGSDNIDPTSVSYATAANIGDSVTITWKAGTGNKYGGIITYIIERIVNSGSWEKWSEKTTLSANFTANSSGTRQFRVYAKDNYGFNSSTYATGPVLTISSALTVSLSASPANGGTVSGGGSYSNGESVTVVASPNSGYNFSNWSEGDASVSTSSSYTFTVSKSRSLTAVFTESTSTTWYPVVLIPSPENGGVVYGEGRYDKWSEVTVKAVANSGYTFAGWYEYENDNKLSDSNSYTITVTSQRILVAKFDQDALPPIVPSTPSGKSMNPYVGIDNIAKKVSNIYVGINGVARKVIKGYIGASGVARLFYSQGIDFKVTSVVQRTLSASIPYDRVIYANGKFYVLDYQEITEFNNNTYYSAYVYSSSDGLTWIEANEFIPNYDKKYFKIYDIAYGNGIFIIPYRNATTSGTYENGVYGSTDGEEWWKYSSDTNWIRKVAFGKGKFVGLSFFSGLGLIVCVSTDGRTWSEKKIIEDQTIRSADIVFQNNQFIINVSAYKSSEKKGYNYIYNSPDASTWTKIFDTGGVTLSSSMVITPFTTNQLPSNKIISAHYTTDSLYYSDSDSDKENFTLDYTNNNKWETSIPNQEFINGQLLKNKILAYFAKDSSLLYTSNNGVSWNTIDLQYSLIAGTCITHTDNQCLIITNNGKTIIKFDFE